MRTSNILSAGQECKTPRGVPGICMAVDDCIPISILFRKEQTTQEELQFLEESECDSETLVSTKCLSKEN